MAAHRGETYWQTLLLEYQESELTQKAFVESKGISISSFQYWLYRSRRKSNGARDRSEERIRLLPIAVRARPGMQSLPARSRSLCLKFGDAYRLRFEEGTDCDYIARLTWAMFAPAGRC